MSDKVKKNRFVFYLLIIFFGFVNLNAFQGHEIYDPSEIIVASPFGCVSKISIYQNGYGAIETGYENGDRSDEGDQIDSSLVKNTFQISKRQDQKRINEILLKMNLGDSLIGREKLDAFRIKIKINNKTKLDVYGTTEDASEIIALLIPYLPAENDQCGYFHSIKAIKP